MLRVLEVILLGIVEGITEWLPISSTGHMLLLYKFFGIDQQEPFWNMFLVVIQLGAILAVILMYFRRLWPFQKPDPDAEGIEKLKSVFVRSKFIMWFKIAVSCVPAVVVGLTIDDWIEEHFYNYIVVDDDEFAGDVLVLTKVRKIADISWSLALWIGFFQALAIIPGTSRSGATILGGLILGMSRKCASEYTFFLAIPTMFGASLLKIVKFFSEGSRMAGIEIFYLILGMVIAFVTSVAAIKFLISYIRKHNFKIFGIYRIILGAIVLLVFAISAAIG